MKQNESIDIERAVSDPAYRRKVIERLKAEAARETPCRRPAGLESGGGGSGSESRG